jgi:hypothetical protein
MTASWSACCGSARPAADRPTRPLPRVAACLAIACAGSLVHPGYRSVLSATHDTINYVSDTSIATEISVGVAAVSAIAAAISARASVRGIALGHRPFVVGDDERDVTELGMDPDAPEMGVVGVRLRNEGPGVAVAVRFRVRAWGHPDIDTYWSPRIDSLAPGAELKTSLPFSAPPGVTDVELMKAEAPETPNGEQLHEPDYVLWYVETQFTDITGATWLVRPAGTFQSSQRPRRVRSHWFELWRRKGASWR